MLNCNLCYISMPSGVLVIIIIYIITIVISKVLLMTDDIVDAIASDCSDLKNTHMTKKFHIIMVIYRGTDHTRDQLYEKGKMCNLEHHQTDYPSVRPKHPKNEKKDSVSSWLCLYCLCKK